MSNIDESMVDDITAIIDQTPGVLRSDKNKMIAWLERHKPVEHLELKAGHWYICYRPFCCRADHLTVKEGERFMCEKDDVVKGFVIKDAEKYFKECNAPAPYEDEQKSKSSEEDKDSNVNDETNAPTEYGKYVDECLNEASKHFFSEGEDKYSVADLFYAGVRCGRSWLEKQVSKSQDKVLEDSYITPNKEFFQFIYDRLRYVHKENPNTDYMLSLKERISNMHYLEQSKSAFKASDWYVNKVDGKIHNIYQSVDKVEPKFKVGDFIVNDYCMGKVIELTNDAYLLDTGQGIPFSCEHNVHLWTIQDAKDGDVLIDKSSNRECPFIFKETKQSDIKTDMLNPLTVLGYCGIGGAGFTKGSGWGDTANCIYYPATKEQHNLLFNKMKEAGYEWDAEKKELRKIEKPEEKSVDKLKVSNELYEHIRKTCAWIDDALSSETNADITDYLEMASQDAQSAFDMIEKQGEQKSKWTEEDDHHWMMCLECVEECATQKREDFSKTIDWLKSIKQRLGEKIVINNGNYIPVVPVNVLT